MGTLDIPKVFVGLESTAHTFGVGVLDLDGNILANERESFVTDEGGMVPMEVRRHHERVGESVWKRALEKVGVDESDVVGIGFSNAPGLAPCLLAGMEFVKDKARRLEVPVIEVNHCVAHLVVGEKFGARDPVMLYASGANTQIVGFEGGRFRVFGETLDLGVGNFIDTVGRMMKLGFPAGAEIEKLAKGYEENSGAMKNMIPDLLELPYVVKGMDVSLSGIQTKIRDLVVKGEDRGRIAYAMQETVFAMLVEVAERALAHTGKKEMLIGGGVGCNERLVEMCRIMCEERGCELIVPSKDLLIDNGAMIGYLGLKMWRKDRKGKGLDEVDIRPRERTDDVEVWWEG